MSIDKHLENDFLNLDLLPRSDASLSEIIRFVDSQDPMPKFRKIWGDDYARNVEILWQRCIQTFGDEGPIDLGPSELLLCLKYDCAMAPYLSRPESESLRFYRWLTGQIEKRLIK